MKTFGTLCYALGIVIAIGVGMFVVEPSTNSQLDFIKSSGGGAGCSYSGYTEVECAFALDVCTSGNMKAATTTPGEESLDFKSAGTNSRRGDCAGEAGSGCQTPTTTDLTSQGCGS